MSALQFRLYSRRDCHLCEEMHAVVAPIAAELGAMLEEVDIATDPQLEAAYGMEIPVLLINGRKAFKYRVSTRELSRYLRRHE